VSNECKDILGVKRDKKIIGVKWA